MKETCHKCGAPAYKSDGNCVLWCEKCLGIAITPTIFRTEPKIGRNNPCPCGSGKKYKNCCIS